MASFSVFDGTTWRAAKGVWVYDGTTWRAAKSASVYDGAAWRKGYADTYTVEGYCDWTASYIFGSSTDATGTLKSDTEYRLYQGLWSDLSYYYRNVINFDTVMGQARGANITKVELKLSNEHSYYAAGLDTYITGGWACPTTRPSTYPLSSFGSDRYSNNTAFTKGEMNKWITLNGNIATHIKNNNIDSLHTNAVAGWALADYGYFYGVSSKPYLRITCTY